jgi:hypothetical protein
VTHLASKISFFCIIYVFLSSKAIKSNTQNHCISPLTVCSLNNYKSDTLLGLSLKGKMKGEAMYILCSMTPRPYCAAPLIHGNQSAQNRWQQSYNRTTRDLHKCNIWQQILHLCLFNIVLRQWWGPKFDIDFKKDIDLKSFVHFMPESVGSVQQYQNFTWKT